ncbi:MAG: FliM/FliN family flagellar motor switch protein [Candidatus Melainabacteria bacterium]|nr:FliM/FliN family flagellar motor switch protein [Candidatus Melainabacteria bacterium]
MKNRNKELIRNIGMNPLKPDSFQAVNEPLMNNLLLWSNESIDLHDIIQSFFGVKVRTKIVAILLDLDLNNWIGVAGAWQHNNHNGQIRIDAKLTEFLLNNAFGLSPVNQPFNIKKINQLELNILQTFLSNIETKMKEFWEIDAKYPFLMDIIYLVWLVQSEEGDIGRIAFGLPASFKPKRSAKAEGDDAIDITKLANTGIKVPINLLVGSTRLSVSEIKSFEAGDLVIFEDSDTGKFQWHLGEIGLVLPEEDHPVFLRDIDSIQELAKEMVKTTHNIDEDPLSSLPLELSAEFQKVLIPLKQVLELKSGGVLPLGPVLDSELVLTAQGRPVAKGELVIVGNQFGMRITDLLIGLKKSAKSSSGVELEDLFGKQQQTKTKAEQPGTFADELQDLEES